MAVLDFQSAFELYQKQASSADQVWTFYSGVVIALDGAVIGSDKLKASWEITLTVLGVFAVFAAGNAIVVYNTQEVAFYLSEAVKSFAGKDAILVAALPRASTGCQVLAFHIACDVAVIGTLFLISKKAWSKPAEPKETVKVKIENWPRQSQD